MSWNTLGVSDRSWRSTVSRLSWAQRSGIGARRIPVQSTRRSREELRTTLVEEGLAILLAEGLEAGSRNLTFKRVFDRVEAKSGLRITNASVIKRIWENQADFQADVLVTIARGEARRAQVSGQRVVTMVQDFDMTSPQSRSHALAKCVGWKATRAVRRSTSPPTGSCGSESSLWQRPPRHRSCRPASRQPLPTNTNRSPDSGARTSSLSSICSGTGSATPGRWTTSVPRPSPSPRAVHFVNLRAVTLTW